MARSRVGRRTRRVLVFLHVVVSLGWMGAGAANVVLAATALTVPREVARVCYHLIDRIDVVLVIPAAFGALVTGVALGLVTPWGLARHWWVLVKLVLTVAVIVFSTFFVGVWVLEGVEDPGPSAWPLVWGGVANLASFLLMTWASIAKPWGTTPWTRRDRQLPGRHPSDRGPSTAARTRRSSEASVAASAAVSPIAEGSL
ncbi:membrane protein [Actinomycetospora chlora]|uniref:Membrane protein n=1 Tax=Actinomycetospora chlora TaxID=663608 RepID=A0ABP9BJF2_9PSEU